MRRGDTAPGRVAGRPGGAQGGRMSGPREDDHEDDGAPNNLRPGQYDEGGHGGMATRELEAKEAKEEAGEQAGEQAGESSRSAD